MSKVPGLRQTTRNICILWGQKLVSMAATLLVMGAAVRLYGLEQIGVWILGTTIATYLALLDFGAASALPRTLPRLLRSDNAAGVRLVSGAALLTLLVAGAGILLFAVCGENLANVLLDGHNNTATEQMVLAITILAAILAIPLRVGYGLLASVSRFDIYFGIDLIAQVVRTVLVMLVVVEWRLDIVFFALVATSPSLIANVIQYALGLRHSRIRIEFSWGLLAHARELLSHSGASLLQTFSTMLLIQGSTLAAAQLGTTSVAAIAIPLMLVTQAMSFTAAAGALVTPVASTLSLNSDGDLEAMARNSITASASLSAPLVLSLFLAGPSLMQLWLGAGKADQNALGQLTHVLQLLVVGAFFIGPAAAARGVLMGVGKHWHSATAETASALAGLLFGFLLLNMFELGVYGIAVGVAFGFVVRYLVVTALLIRSITIAPKALLLSTAKPFALLLIGLAPSTLWLGLPDPSMNWREATQHILAGWMIWGLGSWVFVLNKLQRASVISWIRQHLFR